MLKIKNLFLILFIKITITLQVILSILIIKIVEFYTFLLAKRKIIIPFSLIYLFFFIFFQDLTISLTKTIAEIFFYIAIFFSIIKLIKLHYNLFYQKFFSKTAILITILFIIFLVILTFYFTYFMFVFSCCISFLTWFLIISSFITVPTKRGLLLEIILNKMYSLGIIDFFMVIFDFIFNRIPEKDFKILNAIINSYSIGLTCLLRFQVFALILSPFLLNMLSNNFFFAFFLLIFLYSYFLRNFLTISIFLKNYIAISSLKERYLHIYINDILDIPNNSQPHLHTVNQGWFSRYTSISSHYHTHHYPGNPRVTAFQLFTVGGTFFTAGIVYYAASVMHEANKIAQINLDQNLMKNGFMTKEEFLKKHSEIKNV